MKTQFPILAVSEKLGKNLFALVGTYDATLYAVFVDNADAEYCQDLLFDAWSQMDDERRARLREECDKANKSGDKAHALRLQQELDADDECGEPFKVVPIKCYGKKDMDSFEKEQKAQERARIAQKLTGAERRTLQIDENGDHIGAKGKQQD